MTVFGVWRCSTDQQDQERQVRALKEAGCEKIYGDKITGTSDLNSRPELQKCLEEMVSGDVLVISELSRLSLSAFWKVCRTICPTVLQLSNHFTVTSSTNRRPSRKH